MFSTLFTAVGTALLVAAAHTLAHDRYGDDKYNEKAGVGRVRAVITGAAFLAVLVTGGVL